MATLAALLLPPLVLAAPPSEAKVEVSLFVGASLFDANMEEVLEQPTDRSYGVLEKDTLGGSFLLGFRAGYFITRRWELEAGFAVAASPVLRKTLTFFCLPGQRCPQEELVAEERVVAYQYDVALIFEPLRGAARPFLTVGLGGTSHAGVREPDSGSLSSLLSPPLDARASLAYVVGAGVKVDMGSVAVRFELVDRILHDHFLTSRTEHDAQLRAGLAFRVR